MKTILHAISWRDLQSLAALMAEKFFVGFFPGEPYCYREERTLITIFIEETFACALRNKLEKVDVNSFLRKIAAVLGLSGYENTASIIATCTLLVSQFHKFCVLDKEPNEMAYQNMWYIDVSENVYSPNGQRRFYVIESEKISWQTKKNGRRWRMMTSLQYTVVESWRNEDGAWVNTRGWDFYTFSQEQEARMFLAHLVLKLNSSQQNQMLKIADEITHGVHYGLEKEIRRVKRERKQNHGGQLLSQQQTTAKTPANTKAVYVFDMGNGNIKIGVSVNVSDRKATISNSSGLPINRYCHTAQLSVKQAMQIEGRCHHHFWEQHTLGEFFKITYEEARDYLSTLAPIAFESEY